MNHLPTKTCKYRGQLWKKQRNGHKTTLTDCQRTFPPTSLWLDTNTLRTDWTELVAPSWTCSPASPRQLFLLTRCNTTQGHPFSRGRSYWTSENQRSSLPSFHPAVIHRQKLKGPVTASSLLAEMLLWLQFHSGLKFFSLIIPKQKSPSFTE